MNIKDKLRLIIRENVEMHRCMNGKMVKPQSQPCLVDILARIEDAEFHRGHHSCGTENRVYYNGLLKGLRSKRNRLQKVLTLEGKTRRKK